MVHRRAPSRPNVPRAHPHETQAFQTSKQLPIHVAPQKAIPFVSSSSPAQAARPLSRPLQSASGDNPTSPSPSPLSESNRQLAWSVVACLLTMALIGELQLQHVVLAVLGRVPKGWAPTCAVWRCRGGDAYGQKRTAHARAAHRARQLASGASGPRTPLFVSGKFALHAGGPLPVGPSTDSRPRGHLCMSCRCSGVPLQPNVFLHPNRPPPCCSH